MIIYIVMLVMFSIEMYFLVKWAMGEQISPRGGTKLTREVLPKAYLVDIA